MYAANSYVSEKSNAVEAALGHRLNDSRLDLIYYTRKFD